MVTDNIRNLNTIPSPSWDFSFKDRAIPELFRIGGKKKKKKKKKVGNLLPSCKAAWKKKASKSWWTPSWPWACNMPWCQRRIMISWAALGKVLPAGQGRGSFPSTQHWWGHTCSAVSSSGLPSISEVQSYWRESNKGPRRWRRD